jgi:hypothetical protein
LIFIRIYIADFVVLSYLFDCLNPFEIEIILFLFSKNKSETNSEFHSILFKIEEKNSYFVFVFGFGIFFKSVILP